MRKVLLAALCTACVALLAPALAGAAVIVPANMTVGNDLGHRSAVVNYALPTTSDEGALVGPTVCLPAPDSTFLVGTTTVACSSFYQFCILPGICIPLPVAGAFDVTVNIVRCTLRGDGVANDLVGTAQRDWICGLGGADVLRGKEGADTLVGGGGGDLILAGAGRDSVAGGRGNDTIKVRDGQRDTVNCGLGPHDLVIADSHDVIRANCERVRRG